MLQYHSHRGEVSTKITLPCVQQKLGYFLQNRLGEVRNEHLSSQLLGDTVALNLICKLDVLQNCVCIFPVRNSCREYWIVFQDSQPTPSYKSKGNMSICNAVIPFILFCCYSFNYHNQVGISSIILQIGQRRKLRHRPAKQLYFQVSAHMSSWGSGPERVAQSPWLSSLHQSTCDHPFLTTVLAWLARRAGRNDRLAYCVSLGMGQPSSQEEGILTFFF